ncbi:MAG: 30S ribosomal protein S9 [Bacteroidales bacterium]|nr:30S ribosomal protein S9 [Bacteroidales bacterium]
MAEKKEQKTFYLGTGRRKTSVARVRVSEGKGQIVINGRSLDSYFTEEKDRAAVTGPMNVTDLLNRVDVTVKVLGGGITGQSGAIGLGIARALKVMFGPADERKTRIFNHTTIVRSLRSDAKKETAPTAPATEGAATAEETSGGGMVKKLRDSGYLTRDSRMKERKKYGLRGARRGTQFSKR